MEVHVVLQIVSSLISFCQVGRPAQLAKDGPSSPLLLPLICRRRKSTSARRLRMAPRPPALGAHPVGGVMARPYALGVTSVAAGD